MFRNTRILDIRHVEYKVVLPNGFEAVHEPVGHLEPDVHLAVSDELDNEGRRTFTWRADLVPAGKMVGIRLELSGSSAHATAMNPLGTS